VTRAFGGTENIKAEISSPQSLESGSHAFLLCTDGFWEYVLEPEMEQDLAISGSPHEWLTAMVQKIVDRAPGDNDNYTAAAVFVEFR
jgi:serine/threonine protein phosphatase PrpC